LEGAFDEFDYCGDCAPAGVFFRDELLQNIAVLLLHSLDVFFTELQ
jgi:hypothetical protein